MTSGTLYLAATHHVAGSTMHTTPVLQAGFSKLSLPATTAHAVTLGPGLTCMHLRQLQLQHLLLVLVKMHLAVR
jgi:hypothetical protein